MGKVTIVIGATGVVGRELVAQLAEQENVDEVVCITRRPVDYSSTKIRNQVVDFDRLEESTDLFKGDILFSALGTTLKQAGGIDAQRKIDLDYQFHAARLAAEQGVSHYMLVSSSGANPSSKSAYLKMKGELEQKVQNLSFARITLIQPSLLLGKRADFRLGEKIGAFLLPLICKLPGLSKYRPITGIEVAKAMVRISEQKGAHLERFVLDDLFV